MDNKQNSFPLDHVAGLRSRQATILAEIDALTRTTPNNISPDRGSIASLKQEYNEIAEKRAGLEGEHLPDPLQVLPPELWPNVFGEVVHDLSYPVDVLLDLTLVSKTWLDALISLAQLWTKIRLDNTKADCHAKALMGIHLSGEREIELHIGYLRLHEWRIISPKITPQGRDAHHLPRWDVGNILKDFSDLPVLRDLLLYQQHAIPDFTIEDLRGLDIKDMPSLERIDGLKLSQQHTPWNRFITSHWLNIESITHEVIDSLALLPVLTTLVIYESIDQRKGMDNHASTSAPCLKSVEMLTYNGYNLLNCMKWFGDCLTDLLFNYPLNTDPAVVFLAVSRFQRLQFLKIKHGKASGAWPTQDERNEANFDLSVKELLLLDAEAGWDDIIRTLMTVSSLVVSLRLEYINLNDSIWTYIAIRGRLEYLHLYNCEIDESALPVSLNMDNMKSLRWDGNSRGLEKIFSKVRSQALRRLHFTTNAVQKDQIRELKHCGSSSHAFANITSLIIDIAVPVAWELGSFPRLRELKVRHGFGKTPPDNWESYVYDQILLKPRDTPLLEKIAIAGTFYQWDILIILLERKNFLNEPGISHIKTIVSETALPYRLLHPISELLGGRLVERDSNSSFSIEAIGRRVWDQSR